MTSRLDQVGRRCEEATPGTWKCWNGWGPKPDGDMAMLRIGPQGHGGIHSGGGDRDICATVEDAEFVAMARTDLPDLARDFRVVAEALRGLAFAAAAEDDDPYEAALALVDAWLGEESR